MVFGSQISGDRQSASALHAELQAFVPLHRNGAHATVAAVRQVPAPSHVRAFVWVDFPAGQLASAQTVLIG